MLCPQVLGNAKGVAAVAISIALFHNPFSALAAVGYFITLCGVFAYAEAKRKGAPAATPAALGHEKEALQAAPGQQAERVSPRLSPRLASKPSKPLQ